MTTSDALSQFMGAWVFNLFLLTNLVGVMCLYVWGVYRLNERDHRSPWPIRRTLSLGAALALLTFTYLGPLGAWGHTFFWAHMTQHLIVMMVVAPLVVLSAPVTLAVRLSSSQTRRRWIIPVLRSRTVRFLTDPIVTWLLFATVLLGTHFTPFYGWALRSHELDSFVQQPLYLVAALLYYYPLIGSNLQPKRPAPVVRLVSLALMMIPEAIVGAVIYFSPVILYPAFTRYPRPFGPDPLSDQQLAGALMWTLAMLIDSFWMMVVAAEWFTSEEQNSRRIDAQIASERTGGS